MARSRECGTGSECPDGHQPLARDTFIAIGLFNAGFLGAICISLASSWAFGEVFGWAHSLNLKIREAPWFYACYLFALVSAGAVVLIPHAPLVLITLFVQVIAVNAASRGIGIFHPAFKQ